MEYKIHTYDKVRAYEPKIKDYKIKEPSKFVPYDKVPTLPKRSVEYKGQTEYKIKEYNSYKEYEPPWNRGKQRI